MVEDVAVLIPAYQPDESLVALVEELRAHFVHVVVVDDGSTVGAESFASVRPRVDALLAHERNRGKGAALRTGFAWIREYLPHVEGVVTADADGQHKVADICRRNGVIIVSDEIHCELEMPGYHFTPMATIDQDNTITMNSPSKSFNIAGLGISNLITNNPDWRKQIDKVINVWEHCDLNPFGVLALQAAYNEGEQWIKELMEYIQGNYRMLVDFFESELPLFPVTKAEGTYLAWVDVSAIKMPALEIEKSLIENEKVWINGGEMYGLDGFVRINMACQRERLREALERIGKGLKRLLK